MRPRWMRRRRTSAVIVRALDQAGNALPFLADAVRIEVEGPGRLIGPATVHLAGGPRGSGRPPPARRVRCGFGLRPTASPL